MPKKKKRPKKAAANARPSYDQRWDALYEAADQILGLDPWKHFAPHDLLAYFPRSLERAVFFHFISDEESAGILIFPDTASYHGFSRDASTMREDFRLFIESHTYTMQLLPWEELPPGAPRLLRKLGYKPTGNGDLVPYFLHKRPGYMAVPVESSEELDFLIDCMGNLYMELLSVLEHKVPVDFEGGEMLVRYYSPKDELWLNHAAPVALPPLERKAILIRDDSPKLAHLLDCPANPDGLRVEFDFSWSLEEAFEDDGKTCYYPVLVAFTDRVHKTLLIGGTCRPEDLMDCAFSFWAELIEQHGRPDMLYVSRDESFGLFEDFAGKLGVKIKLVKRLPAAERILRDNGAV